MSCTVAEIAEKRRQARERLNQRKNYSSLNKEPLQRMPTTTNTVTSPGTASKSTSNFYGNSTNQKSIELSNYERKIKKSPEPHTSNRILSQPYSTRHETSNQNTASSVNKSRVIFPSTITCTCSMITENRFEVSVTGYHAKLIDVFKSIPTRAYDHDKRIWSFNLSDYDLVRERVSGLNPEVTIGAIPKFVLNLLRSEKKEIDFSCIQAIEPKLSDLLLDFQKYGVAFGVANSGRCMIADEMGLGKTYQAIAIADFYKDDWPLLIVTMGTARDAWADHIRNLLPWVPTQSIGRIFSSNDHIGDYKVVITSYQLMDKNCHRLLEKNFGFLILDESHNIKNFKTKSAKSATRLGEKAKRVVLLTGTPATSRPAELFCQLNMLDKKFFGGFKEYSYRYCAGKTTNFGFDSSGQSNLKELNVILCRKFMIRRTKEEVKFQLGDKSRETILLDSSKVWNSQDDSLTQTIENCKEFSSDIMKLKGSQRDEVLMRFYAETACLKAKAVCSYVKNFIPQKEKFIVFAHHKVMLDALSKCVESMNVDYIRIDGSTKNDIRSKYIERFQKEKSCQVAVLSLKACNAAITLTAATVVLFAELDWNPSTLAQCESRAHRIGQKGSVVCRYLLAKGTADDYIWETLKKKQAVLNKAGLFSEDLSDATHSSVPVAESSQITSYFSATDELGPKKKENTAINKNNNVVKTNQTEPMETECFDDSYKQMLDDNDDAAFLELDF